MIYKEGKEITKIFKSNKEISYVYKELCWYGRQFVVVLVQDFGLMKNLGSVKKVGETIKNKYYGKKSL